MSDPRTYDDVLLDVNAIVVAALSDHPGHEYVFPALDRGFDGETTLLVHDYLPFRAQYIIVNQYDVDRYRARNVIQQFLSQPIEIVAADTETLLDAYEISAEKNHDVYDCFFLALARRHDADAVLTTDTDFDQLCENESFTYWNPVPDDVLSRFDRGV